MTEAELRDFLCEACLSDVRDVKGGWTALHHAVEAAKQDPERVRVVEEIVASTAEDSKY